MPKFSDRTAWDRTEGEYAAAVRRAKASGVELLDLTVSNPTVCGFAVDVERTLRPMLNPAGVVYRPDARGMAAAREAVAAVYRERGALVSAEDALLTASTSEAYSFLFQMLGDVGDEVLIAQPSYPLFDYLADMAGLRLKPYPLFYDHGWWIDTERMEAAVTARTRAVVLVHPNNPTGHATGAVERRAVEAMCARHGLAMVVDEVFLDFPLREGERLGSFAEGDHPVLTFVLNGLSKTVAMPQMKVGWAVVCGPEPAKTEAMARLEMMGDTFLSVGTPAQLALPVWLNERGRAQAEILRRVRRNFAALRAGGVEVMEADAGWSAMLRVPRVHAEATAAEALLGRGIVTHPAALYGLEEPSRVVVSLLTPEPVMDEALARMRELPG